jgi:hypothetical protein
MIRTSGGVTQDTVREGYWVSNDLRIELST